METQTLNQPEPNFSREDIMQAPFSEEDLQRLSNIADETLKSGNYMTEEEFDNSFE